MRHGIEAIEEAGRPVDCATYAGQPAWHMLGQRVGDAGDPRLACCDVESSVRADWSVVTDRV